MKTKNISPEIAEKFTVIKRSLHDYWRLYIAEGAVLIILGVLAMVVPLIASLTVSIFLGWLLLISGGFGFGVTALNRRATGFFWSLLSAVVAIIAGIYLIAWPLSGVISLTFILTAFLIIDGISMIFLAIEHRRQLSQRWGWMLMNGVLDLALAGFIVWTLPASVAWVLGIIVGIDMLFGGFSLIMMALAAHKNIQPPSV